MLDYADDATLRTALAEERLRNIGWVNDGRALVLLVTFTIELYFQATRTGYLGGSLALHGGWLAAAALVDLASRRSRHVARHAGLFVAFVDMPVFFLLIRGVVDNLAMTRFAVDAAAVSAGVTVFFALMILLSGALLEQRQLYASLVLSLLLLLWLQIDAHVDASVIAFMIVAIVSAFAISVSIGRRTIALVTAVTDEQMRRARLGRYFSPQVTERLLQRNDDSGRGENRDVTVLFADLREFTAIGESMRGPDVVALLNSVHEALVDAIFEHGGTLDKYMGDGIMAYFGAPMDQPDHPVQALRCAAAMQTALASLNERRRANGDDSLRLGIGVHSGRVVLGDIGATRRREFTVIGHTVNIAARLEQLTKQLGVPILVSEETATRARDQVALTAVDTVAIRGQTEPMRVFTLAPSA